MKKGFRKVCAALCSTALLCAATAVPASASTVSDVIAAAYAVGIPAPVSYTHLTLPTNRIV